MNFPGKSLLDAVVHLAGESIQGRWTKAKTDELPRLDEVATWLDANLPADADDDAALIHNDYKYDNVVLDPRADEPGRIIAVLEMTLSGHKQREIAGKIEQSEATVRRNLNLIRELLNDHLAS